MPSSTATIVNGSPRKAFNATPSQSAANILTAIGFALLLTGVYAIRGQAVTWREGLAWGLAGFIVFTAAPGLGLPPELPGMPVADLTARQTWWIATAAATAGGLCLLTFRSTAWAAVLGLALIALPHLIGAPLAPESHSDVPHALSQRFIVVVTLTSLLFWALSGYFHQHRLWTHLAPAIVEITRLRTLACSSVIEPFGRCSGINPQRGHQA